MKNKRILFWITGTITAFAGVYVARVLSLKVPVNLRVEYLIAGFSISILGLFIITLGTWRKY